eukprot:3912118-Alexandrium_andersonii.AAC.2
MTSVLHARAHAHARLIYMRNPTAGLCSREHMRMILKCKLPTLAFSITGSIKVQRSLDRRLASHPSRQSAMRETDTCGSAVKRVLLGVLRRDMVPA